jgi:agmatinase
MSKEELINSFDPNGVGALGSLFGLPFEPEHSEVVIIPVPWEVTVSYGSGTSDGPLHVLESSPQLDVFVKDIPDAWKMGVSMLPIPAQWLDESEILREQAEKYILWLEEGAPTSRDENLKAVVSMVNEASEKLNKWVKEQAMNIMEDGKLPVVLGGDHSTPLGLIRALAEKNEEFGILQIDAHADLRDAYEGFEYSHASIMFNALKVKQVSKLVQVGIRDYCEEEYNVVQSSQGRVVSFYDQDLKTAQYEGKSWKQLCEDIVFHLPENVYISFDIDGLDPKLCPSTGTPVPGGFEYEEAMYLIKTLVKSGRKIIGCDLCEVSPSENPGDQWNGNVGARVLWGMVNLMGVSQNKLKLV